MVTSVRHVQEERSLPRLWPLPLARLCRQTATHPWRVRHQCCLKRQAFAQAASSRMTAANVVFVKLATPSGALACKGGATPTTARRTHSLRPSICSWMTEPNYVGQGRRRGSRAVLCHNARFVNQDSLSSWADRPLATAYGCSECTRSLARSCGHAQSSASSLAPSAVGSPENGQACSNS